MLAPQYLSRCTYLLEICKELAVEKAPARRRLNVELCFVESLKDFLLDLHRRPLLCKRAVHDEVHEHFLLVEMSRNPFLAPSDLDGVAEKLSLAIFDRSCAKVGGLHSRGDKCVSGQRAETRIRYHSDDKSLATGLKWQPECKKSECEDFLAC